MLPAAARLRRRDDFTRALRAGRRSGRGPLVVHVYCGDPASGSPQVGFIIPRAVGGAVVRNRLRRRLQEMFRARLAELPPGSLLAVRASTGAANLSRDNLQASVDRAVADAARFAAGPVGADA